MSELASPYQVKVSVCMLSYNQADLFREAIESVVTQQTDFPFEVIVCDDASTDGTAEVLREYADRYPHLVVPVFRRNNVGHYVNYVDAHNRARGKYVAHLDGDDVFLPGKLQQQANFLDQHTDVSVLWHTVRLIDAQEKNLGQITFRGSITPDGYILLEDALELGSLGVHSATMYRACARTTTKPDISPIDWFYAVEFLTHGKGYQLKQELGIYRKLEGTSMSSNPASARRVRRHVADMIMYYIDLLPAYRRQLFTLSLLYFLCDLRNGSRRTLYMLRPMWAARTFLSLRQFRSALRRYRAKSRAYRGLT